MSIVYVRNGAWFMWFDRQALAINFRHDTAWRAPRLGTVFEMPASDIKWVRKTIEPDEYDTYFVDVQVSPELWQRVYDFKCALKAKTAQSCRVEPDPFIFLYEGDVIRVQVDRSVWPKDLKDHWAKMQFKVLADYTIKQPSDFRSAKATPREVICS